MENHEAGKAKGPWVPNKMPSIYLQVSGRITKDFEQDSDLNIFIFVKNFFTMIPIMSLSIHYFRITFLIHKSLLGKRNLCVCV